MRLLEVEAFGGHYVLDNFVRLILVAMGLFILMISVKVAYQTWRTREMERFWASLSFGLIVCAPASGSLIAFGKPLSWAYAIPYLLGVVCAIISLYWQIELLPSWMRRLRGIRAGRTSRRSRGE